MKAYHFIPTAAKTYATRDNAVKAVEKVMERAHRWNTADVRYITMQGEDGRWFPVFFGTSAVEHCMFQHFNVIG